ncbi:subtilisin-like protein [Microthyrium microscopicum]|uniref:Subtilisin-like protein n=1 Tax=Microthyrium microscopicum TaxID=703497 RepID=A0A6A6TY42_9PEZI|nr:subtilisin-like protein [Microthyrium microscopicum]
MKGTVHVCLAIASIVQFGNTTPITFGSHTLHEKRDLRPSKWVKRDRIHRDHPLPVRIGLVQNNLENGYQYVMSVSDPQSPDYGKYWTPDQVHKAFSPSQESVDEVKAWLNRSGIATSRVVHSENKGWLAFDAYSHEAERLFNTKYTEYHHSETGDVRIGSDEYHLPSEVKRHIDYVTPGVKMSSPLAKRAVPRARKSKSRARTPARKPIGPIGVPISDGGILSVPLSANATQLPPALQNCGTTMTPTCFKALYKIPNAKGATPGNSVGLYEGGDYYSQADLNDFFATYAPWVPQGTAPKLASVDGGVAEAPQTSPLILGESDVDMDIIFSVVYPQTITLFQTDDPVYSAFSLNSTLDGFLNTFLDALDGSYCTYSAYGETGNDPTNDPIYPDPNAGGYKGKLQCGVYKPTNVISISYGEAEADLPDNYIKRQCNEWMKLALQGHSVFISSGDYGVASYPGDSDSPIGCLGEGENIYNPSTPICPYITSVGATRLYPGQTVLDPESVMQVDLPSAPLFSTGGGFSNVFTRPGYQNRALDYYFDTATPSFPSYGDGDNIGADGGIYNRDGRGYPDVSANGASLGITVGGGHYHEYGTSLAAPLWAAIITLVNEARFTVGKGPVGFVNPVLYTFPQVFTDIKNGSNPGCHSEGFKAVPGWDPVSGLGTPVYPKLEALFLSLP